MFEDQGERKSKMELPLESLEALQECGLCTSQLGRMDLLALTGHNGVTQNIRSEAQDACQSLTLKLLTTAFLLLSPGP